MRRRTRRRPEQTSAGATAYVEQSSPPPSVSHTLNRYANPAGFSSQSKKSAAEALEEKQEETASFQRVCGNQLTRAELNKELLHFPLRQCPFCPSTTPRGRAPTAARSSESPPELTACPHHSVDTILSAEDNLRNSKKLRSQKDKSELLT
ncbi:uncharacterized [Tachysurus ichikawai]